MTSLNVDYLFTSITLDESIEICINTLYKYDENTPNTHLCSTAHSMNKVIMWL